MYQLPGLAGMFSGPLKWFLKQKHVFLLLILLDVYGCPLLITLSYLAYEWPSWELRSRGARVVINVAIWVHFSGLTILIRSCITYTMTFEPFTGGLADGQTRGSFFNYVDHIWPIIDHLATPCWHRWGNSFIVRRKNLHTVDISSTTT